MLASHYHNIPLPCGLGVYHTNVGHKDNRRWSGTLCTTGTGYPVYWSCRLVKELDNRTQEVRQNCAGQSALTAPVVILSMNLTTAKVCKYFHINVKKMLNFCYKNVTILLNFHWPVAKVKYFYTRKIPYIYKMECAKIRHKQPDRNSRGESPCAESALYGCFFFEFVIFFLKNFVFEFCL